MEDSVEIIGKLKELIKIVDNDEDKAHILLYIASCEKSLKLYKNARHSISSARKLVHENSRVHPGGILIIAQINAMEGRWTQVLNNINEMKNRYMNIINNPEYDDVREDMIRYQGMALYNLKRFNEAKPFLEKAVNSQYAKSTSYYFMGSCCYFLSDLNGAIENLRKALNLGLCDEYQDNAHYTLGLSYYWSNKSAWAIKEFKWCMENNRFQRVPRVYVLKALIDAFKSLGQNKEVRHYDKMLRGLDV